jgi:gallate dioxygenase
MALQKPYLDVPGTTIFDADLSRKGFWLNQFCASLMKDGNRTRFKAAERAYLDEWPMSEDQKQAVLARDLNRCISLGGNIYFLARIGATDGKTFQQIAASMTGMTDVEYREMMISGGRTPEGNRFPARGAMESERAKGGIDGAIPDSTARITASVFTSHVPAIGVAIDQGRTGEPYWQPLFRGYEASRNWMQENTPDVVVLIYNDHGTAFGLDVIPTFAIGTAAEFAPADEGWGPRPVPRVIGHPMLA